MSKMIQLDPIGIENEINEYIMILFQQKKGIKKLSPSKIYDGKQIIQ